LPVGVRGVDIERRNVLVTDRDSYRHVVAAYSGSMAAGSALRLCTLPVGEVIFIQ
jgi:hypothetical protein